MAFSIQVSQDVTKSDAGRSLYQEEFDKVTAATNGTVTAGYDPNTDTITLAAPFRPVYSLCCGRNPAKPGGLATFR